MLTCYTVSWGPQVMWLVFLTWFCFVSGPPSTTSMSSYNSPSINTGSLYIRLLVLVFFVEGVYDGHFMLRSSGGERIVLAAALMGIKAGRTIVTPGHVAALALSVGM
jgi:hypothetical protein